ncbi:hypothetical protein HK102_007173 [Quaeritorhiza haematococci]|nr:hypothetical protein HK102_007173 [Quaeritorhiza haematococci]
MVRGALFKSGQAFHPTRWGYTTYELQKADGTIYSKKLPITFLISVDCANEYIAMISTKADASEAEKTLANSVAEAVQIGVENAKNFNVQAVADSLKTKTPSFTSKGAGETSVSTNQTTPPEAALRLESGFSKYISDGYARELEDIALRSVQTISPESFWDGRWNTQEPALSYGIWESDTMPGKKLGIVRITSFMPSNTTSDEFIAILREILISGADLVDAILFDVRGNPGGQAYLGTALTQLVHPEVVQVTMKIRNTQWVRDRVFRVEELLGTSILEGNLLRAADSASPFTPETPIFPLESLTQYGQAISKPVGVYVDGACYSACDMFAANIKDAGAGLIFGSDMATGAGGATVLTYNWFADLDPSDSVEPFPYGQDLSFSFGQLTRADGTLIENAGVEVDALIRPTRKASMESVYNRILDNLLEYGQATNKSMIDVRVQPEEIIVDVPAPGSFDYDVIAVGVTSVEIHSGGNVLSYQNITLSTQPQNITFTVNAPPEDVGNARSFEFVARAESGAVVFRTRRYQRYTPGEPQPAPVPIVITSGQTHSWDITDISNVRIQNNALIGSTVWHIDNDANTGLQALKATIPGTQTYNTFANTSLSALYDFTSVESSTHVCSVEVGYRIYTETGYDWLRLFLVDANTGEVLFAAGYDGTRAEVVSVVDSNICGRLIAAVALFTSDRSIEREGAFIYGGTFAATPIGNIQPVPPFEVIKVSPDTLEATWTPANMEFVNITTSGINQQTVWHVETDPARGPILVANDPGSQPPTYSSNANTQAAFRIDFSAFDPSAYICGYSFLMTVKVEEGLDLLFVGAQTPAMGYEDITRFSVNIEDFPLSMTATFLCGGMLDVRVVFMSDPSTNYEGVKIYSGRFFVQSR